MNSATAVAGVLGEAYCQLSPLVELPYKPVSLHRLEVHSNVCSLAGGMATPLSVLS
jgi:hypothetical protein